VIELARDDIVTREPDEAVSYTMRGLTTGSVKVKLGKGPMKPCVILGVDFPSWVLHVRTLGFCVDQVLVHECTHVERLQAICGVGTKVWCGRDWRSGMTGWTFSDQDITAFVDGRLTTQVVSLLASVGISNIFSTQRPRGYFKGWYSRGVIVDHTAVGGVTSKILSVFRHSKEELVDSKGNSNTYRQRDASTVLTQSVFGVHFRAKPVETYPSPLRVLNLGTEVHPVFHGFGWMPGDLDTSTRILVPVLNSRQHGGKWAVRKVSPKEVLLCKDVPEGFCPLMDTGPDIASGFGINFLRQLLPGKCLIAGYLTLMNGGGDSTNKISTNKNEGGASKSKRQDERKRKCSELFSKPRGLMEEKASYLDKLSSGEREGLAGKVDDAVAPEDLNDSYLDKIAREDRERLAAKADDAAVPEYLWLEHLFEDGPGVWDQKKRSRLTAVAHVFRRSLLAWWKNNVRSSLVQFLHRKYPALSAIGDFPTSHLVEGHLGPSHLVYVWKPGSGKARYVRWWRERHQLCAVDLVPGQDAVIRAARSSWWNWDDGSRPFHWRWQAEYIERIRDGIPVHFLSSMTPYLRPQGDEKDPTVKAQLIEKLQKVRDRRYIAPGRVSSLTAFFGVKKSDDDIRPVYDGSVSGLNDVVWMPRFVLPTIQTHLRQVEAGTFMCDLDVGEMFLNFVLHEELRPLTGVDLTFYAPEANGNLLWECWHRAAMGLTSSPYQACQGMGFAEEIVRGRAEDRNNIFRWDRVRLNLPGSREYDPTKPWVSKIRDNGTIAVDFCTFVDDARPTGPTPRETWLAARRIASKFSYLGLQDAPRKRRDSSQRPGAWTGSVVRTDGGEVSLLVGEDKWNKGKSMIAELIALVDKAPEALPRKRLEQIRGYLVHLAQTYPIFSSYLIGLHMTIDFWRPNRDQDGWRFSVSYVNGMKEQGEWPADYDSLKGPVWVKAVPRLMFDLEALTRLTRSKLPLVRRVRSCKTAQVLYGFGDASGAAFGATIQIGDVINYRYGQWSQEISEHSSSNWRELNNLVCALVGFGEAGHLQGQEMFMFTDNSTAEAAFGKGTSKARPLFELILRLKCLEVECDMILHVVHVSGRRMIAQGTDGLSRADHSQGVMQGQPILDFVPLHLDPLQREPQLLSWLRKVTDGLHPTFLTPDDWFTRGHGVGTFIWCCAPASAEVVVEQLGRARLKRPESMHLIMVPRIMTGRWRRHLTRGSEIYVKIDWPEIWPLDRHFEPVLMFLCLPYRSCNPQLGEQEKFLVEFRRAMLCPFLSEASEERRRYLLRKFLLRARSLCSL
jgi:hypothetical protein